MPAKNEHIEILRAFAILFVVVLHLSILPHFDQVAFLHPVYDLLDLSVGVDLFLVISGFVITRSLLATERRDGVGRGRLVGAFWLRRIFRLLPTAWLWLGVALLINLVSHYLAGTLEMLWGDLAATASAFLNVLNLYRPYCQQNQELIWCTTDYMIGHYWSLSLEEQFYIVFPLLLFFVKRPLFIALLALTIAAQFFWKRPMFSLFYFVKFDALCWGVLLAFASRTGLFQRAAAIAQRRPGLLRGIAGAALIALPLVGAAVQGVWDMRPYGVGTVALLGGIIVFFAALEPGVIGKNLYYRFLLYVGSRSYAIYVIHLIVFVTLGRLVGLIPSVESAAAQIALYTAQCVLGLALTLVLAEWNYRRVEVPWRNHGRELSARVLKSKSNAA